MGGKWDEKRPTGPQTGPGGPLFSLRDDPTNTKKKEAAFYMNVFKTWTNQVFLNSIDMKPLQYAGLRANASRALNKFEEHEAEKAAAAEEADRVAREEAAIASQRSKEQKEARKLADADTRRLAHARAAEEKLAAEQASLEKREAARARSAELDAQNAEHEQKAEARRQENNRMYGLLKAALKTPPFEEGDIALAKDFVSRDDTSLLQKNFVFSRRSC